MTTKRKIDISVDSDLTRSSLSQDGLLERLRFQELITHISTNFIHLPEEKIDQAINNQFEISIP
jgi:hypothetical protein